ncbi:hypothetical protein [Streptosporangium sp. NPDC006007]|uniref:hypothetical protein n=1 Tax=Streptosporangium sp. NPDC006007 TaxID=3154575 RepID=UPI0033B15FC1
MKRGEEPARSGERTGGRRGRGRTRILEISVGTAALATALLALGGALLPARPQTQWQATSADVIVPETGGEDQAAAVTPDGTSPDGEVRRADETRAAGLSKHTDRKALAYFVGHKATKRLKDIRIVGGYLRIYTNLPESASNSKQALKLCETGRDYLVGELGEPRPVVFVQARFGENGNPILANILGPGDSDCRVTHPKPGK